MLAKTSTKFHKQVILWFLTFSLGSSEDYLSVDCNDQSQGQQSLVLNIPYPQNTHSNILQFSVGSCNDWDEVQGNGGLKDYDEESEILTLTIPFEFCDLSSGFGSHENDIEIAFGTIKIRKIKNK